MKGDRIVKFFMPKEERFQDRYMEACLDLPAVTAAR